MLAIAVSNGVGNVRVFGSVLHRSRNGSKNNIKGNDYRVVAALACRFAALYIKFVGTHAQYDAIDAATVENPP